MALRLAALPRQVTAPLAIAIAGIIGADPSLAATIVVITGAPSSTKSSVHTSATRTPSRILAGSRALPAGAAALCAPPRCPAP
eukprot:338755-Prymnesium_polylepis.1